MYIYYFGAVYGIVNSMTLNIFVVLADWSDFRFMHYGKYKSFM